MKESVKQTAKSTFINLKRDTLLFPVQFSIITIFFESQLFFQALFGEINNWTTLISNRINIWKILTTFGLIHSYVINYQIQQVTGLTTDRHLLVKTDRSN